jgi:arabinogalactan endo-1,4-beta-galactosidase
MVHTDNGWKWDTQKWFFDTLLAQGPFYASDYDMIGVSYYPFYNQQATLANLKSSLSQMASRYKKQIVVAETNWPVSCPNPAYPFPSDTTSIPKSAAGQTTWMKNVASIVSGVSGGVGLFYWEPAWVDNAALGSSCPDNAMFEWVGNARSSLSVFNSI